MVKAAQARYWWVFYVNQGHIIQALLDLIRRWALPNATQAERSMENQLSLDPVCTAEL